MYDNLNNYKVFYTVAKTGSISRAADALFISQPAISKSIAKLEEGLSSKLFMRTPKGVVLTDEGLILMQHIEKAFDNITKGEDEIRRYGELGIGQLKIGVSTSLCKHILLDYLQQFIHTYPHIKITIDCHSTVNTMKLLQDEKIDIGLICETEIPHGYTYDTLTEIHDIFVANESYLENLKQREADEPASFADTWVFSGNLTSIVSQKSTGDTAPIDRHPLSIKELLEKSTLMMLESNNITRTHIDSYLHGQGIYPNQILEINNMDLLIDFASIGMGIAGIVREFAADYLESGQIVEIPLATPIQKRTVGFVYANTKTKQTALQNFIDFYKKNNT